MKALILTSSIFYLLGLKLSQNIEPAQKNQPESNPAPVVQEQVEKKVETDPAKDEKTLKVTPQRNDNPVQPDSGSNLIIRNKSTHLMEKMD